MGLVERTTWWTDDVGHTVQVSVAWLDGDTWECLAESTNRIGPFDDVALAHTSAQQSSWLAAHRQLPGQQLLL